MIHRLHTKWWVLNISQHSTSISFPDIFWESKYCLVISCSAGTGVRLISCICVSYFCCRPSLVYFPPLDFVVVLASGKHQQRNKQKLSLHFAMPSIFHRLGCTTGDKSSLISAQNIKTLVKRSEA